MPISQPIKRSSFIAYKPDRLNWIWFSNSTTYERGKRLAKANGRNGKNLKVKTKQQQQQQQQNWQMTSAIMWACLKVEPKLINQPVFVLSSGKRPRPDLCITSAEAVAEVTRRPRAAPDTGLDSGPRRKFGTSPRWSWRHTRSRRSSDTTTIIITDTSTLAADPKKKNLADIKKKYWIIAFFFSFLRQLSFKFKVV